MTRGDVVRESANYVDSGAFLDDLRRRVALPTESQDHKSLPVLQRYLSGEMSSALERLRAVCSIVDNPVPGGGPFLIEPFRVTGRGAA